MFTIAYEMHDFYHFWLNKLIKTDLTIGVDILLDSVNVYIKNTVIPEFRDTLYGYE